jgi:hypothetical protein
MLAMATSALVGFHGLRAIAPRTDVRMETK